MRVPFIRVMKTAYDLDDVNHLLRDSSWRSQVGEHFGQSLNALCFAVFILGGPVPCCCEQSGTAIVESEFVG